MAVDIVLPQIGESMTEATIGRWLKRVGDRIERFEALVEVETDKVSTEVTSIASGILLEIVTPEGATVPVGTLLARIGETAERHVSAAPAPSQETTAAPEPVRIRRGDGPPITPVVARLAAEYGIDLSQIRGTGAGGRVSKKDVLRYIEMQKAAAALLPGAPTAPPPAPEAPPIPSVSTAPSPPLARETPSTAPVAEAPPALPTAQRPPITQPLPDEAILTPLTTMRRMIADHMVRSLRDAPQATTVFEVDMGRVLAHRDRYRASFEQQGIRLTLTAYVVQAVATALRRVPALNTRFTDEGIITYRRINIGVAVALDDGLIVPVLRDADEKSLAGIARALNDLTERARARRLQPDDTEGGTFTISNHGVGGSLFATPILNRGQSGILGVGAVVKRAVVVTHQGNDAIVIRPMCYLSLTFDHRACDGATADAFLAAVKEVLETYPEQ
ncbi:dihydrolipoamide acetyltransferase family protein [Roseiflexus castenholzii]|jgi:2-oxoglutarate dehydrogenase E2 component (dihydrolipoamide succinyltransferase)|uniref:Dihydrolipoamide acetyltransferase component of pyruvate dehydrogenase complex n=1 Tax=Roseiflexus castenholzii (strain DSM 13941 / HLO8) TaxID=383372 RepID=A7NMV1_ROSCS|nr:dihydrolipoamide acetyltransferase family protein [Roseiflexus castenholzii]ABU58875.1 catalytic domain of components of various dehydrogenase complexes [Roseiflexus castenholzii DSM 13941]